MVRGGDLGSEKSASPCRQKSRPFGRLKILQDRRVFAQSTKICSLAAASQAGGRSARQNRTKRHSALGIKAHSKGKKIQRILIGLLPQLATHKVGEPFATPASQKAALSDG